MGCFRNGNECPYKEICKNKTSNGDCYKMCTKFHEISILFENAGIPRRYLQPYKLYPSKKDVYNYEMLNEIKNNILQIVREGFNIYICSSQKLNGKTSWAIKILQNYLHYVRQEPGSRKRGLYVDIYEYLRELKASFDEDNTAIREFEKDIDNVDLVIWDNIDENKLSEWEKGNIRQHIKKRLSNNLSNIFVGNNLDNKLSMIVGQDLKYYIQDNSTIIPLLDERGGIK